jgi:hypothetical protein
MMTPDAFATRQRADQAISPGRRARTSLPVRSYLATTISYSADYLLPFAFRRVFIDSDNNAGTGYHTFSSPSIGADYVIEGSTLLQHVGDTSVITLTQ